jgi:uncharacterized damage-inducible protein DinB
MLWINRKFEFVLPVEMYPNILERLRGTPARLEEKLAGLTREVLTRKPDDKWSIQEQVGHLSDVEELWHGRIDDYLNGLKELRPADITNRVTILKNHNADTIANLLRSFRSSREKLVSRFERFDIPGAGQSAHHPRLNKPMRVIDLAYFIAEHDDHHLARMTELLRLFG